MDLPDAPMKSAACCFHANRIATILLVAQIVSAHRSRGCREVGVLTAVALHSELLALLEVRAHNSLHPEFRALGQTAVH